MLQFNKSDATNKNAVYLDTVNTGSGYYDSIRVVYSQSYDLSSGSFEVSASSVPNAYRNWLVIENTGSVVPSPSGQYDVKLYTYTGSVAQQAIWGQWSDTWTATAQLWGNISGSSEGITLLDLLYEDRAFISGSNEVSITQYVSPDELGQYVTYNG